MDSAPDQAQEILRRYRRAQQTRGPWESIWQDCYDFALPQRSALAPSVAPDRRADRSVWASPFAVEMREWRPGGGGRDDGLDAVAGCLLSEPVRFGPPESTVKRKDWRPGAGGHAAKTEFEP